MMIEITFVIALISLVISVYLVFFKKQPKEINGKRILTINTDEMNVTTKIVENKRVLIDENKEILDKTRIFTQ